MSVCHTQTFEHNSGVAHKHASRMCQTESFSMLSLTTTGLDYTVVGLLCLRQHLLFDLLGIKCKCVIVC